MHLFLTDSDTAPFLADELRRAAPDSAPREIDRLGIAADVNLDGLLLAFARQTLPDAIEVHAASINAWADRIIESGIILHFQCYSVITRFIERNGRIHSCAGFNTVHIPCVIRNGTIRIARA